MKKTIFIIFLLSGCTTPTTILQNAKTGQIARCGGNISSSLAGGAIGYHMQKDNDYNCVIDYQGQGFKVISKTE